MMAKLSEPRFVPRDERNEIDKSKNKTAAFCKCPLPLSVITVDGIRGGYYHVVEYDKEYKCKKCGLTFLVRR